MQTKETIPALRALFSQESGQVITEIKYPSTTRNKTQNCAKSRDRPLIIGELSKKAARRAGRIESGFFPDFQNLKKLIKLVGLVKQSAM